VLAIATVSVLLILLFVCRAILKNIFGRKSHEENTDSRKKKQKRMKIILIMNHRGSSYILHPTKPFNPVCYLFFFLFLLIRSNILLNVNNIMWSIL